MMKLIVINKKEFYPLSIQVITEFLRNNCLAKKRFMFH